MGKIWLFLWVITMMIVLFPISCLGQASKIFIFNKQLENANSVQITSAFSRNHFLGQEVAQKLFVLEGLYTYEVEGTPTSPGTKTIIEKPAIYHSLTKLNNYYRKLVRSGKMTREEAADVFMNYINIGISIVYQNTNEFENYIKSYKKPEDIVLAYSNVVLQE